MDAQSQIVYFSLVVVEGFHQGTIALPETNFLVCMSCNEGFPVVAVNNGPDGCVGIRESTDGRTVCLPELDAAIDTHGSQFVAVGVPGNIPNSSLMSAKRLQQLTVGGPNFDRAIAACRG